MVNHKINVTDIFKFDQPDPNIRKYFDPKLFNMAQQIIQQREFVKIAQLVNMKLNEGESFDEILKRMAHIDI